MAHTRIQELKAKGEDGIDGISLPGQIPIQKEWIVGDTHRFNDEIKDFIYVRGVSSNTSYWYTRTSKGDVVADAAPVGGADKEGYTRVDWLKTLAVNVLLAEEANLANFIFKDEKLISVRGTVDNVEVDYSGQAGFVPNIILDGKTGKIYAQNAEITGTVNAASGEIGDFTIENGKLVVTYSWFTYVGPSYVQVTQKTTFQPSGVLVEASYGGTVDHPQVVSWNAKFDSGGVTVGGIELRRDGLYRDGVFVI